MTNNALAPIDDHLCISNPPKLHKSLQKIGLQQNRCPLWGVRMGGSDYAQHNFSGSDEENRRLMYDEQIDLTTPPTTHATPSEPTDIPHDEGLKAPSRKAERRSIERPRSDSAISHPRNCSSVAAKERSPRVAWAPPAPSPKILVHAGMPVRRRPRHGSFPSSSPRKLTHHSSHPNRKRHRHTASGPPGLVTASLPQDCMAVSASTWFVPPDMGEGPEYPFQQNYQPFNTSTPNHFPETSLTQTGQQQQIFTGAPYIAAGGTPMPGYDSGQAYGVQWSYSYPMNQQVPVTPSPYGSGPDVNRHAPAYAGVSTYQTSVTPTFPM